MSDYLGARYDLPTCYAGDTFPGLTVSSITVGGAAMTSALSSVRMQVRTTANASTASLSLTSGGGDITIDDAAAWGITVDPFTISLSARDYVYDLEFTDAGGTIRTYLFGKWRIEQDVTR